MDAILASIVGITRVVLITARVEYGVRSAAEGVGGFDSP